MRVRARVLGVVVALGVGAGCDSRKEALERQVRDHTRPKQTVEIEEQGPSHEIRDQLAPVLSKIYALNQVPRILEADIAVDGEYKYELEPGVAAVLRFPAGLSTEERVRAVVVGVAEADAWAFRKNARRDYADLIHRVFRGYGEDQKQAVLKSYAQLRLLDFFNSEEAGPAIAAVPADLQGPLKALEREYVGNKKKIWDDWMAVKMYARRVVAGDEPFRSVLREIKKELGQEEPPPRTWEESVDAPLLAYAKQVRADDELMIRLTNMKELRDREEYLGDTHTIWAIQGSELVPAKAKDLRIDPALGFGVLREDLGGGYNDLTFVFSKKLSGVALQKAFVRSVIYSHLLHDFGMLATAGSDFAKRDENNVIDSTTSIVPDEYDPLYAKCGSGAATDVLIGSFKAQHPTLAALPGSADSQKALNAAHQCIIEGARGVIHIPPKNDDKDVEGPAPGSRLAIYQMLARYENIDVDIAAMDKRTEEDDDIEAGEALLKKLKGG